jgi:hypothetical protein
MRAGAQNAEEGGLAPALKCTGPVGNGAWSAITRGGIINPFCSYWTNSKSMELNTLKDLYIHELKDLFSAERQLLKALPKMAKTASTRNLPRDFRAS